MIIDHFAARATITFKQVQGHRVTVCQQWAYLVSLQAFYLNTINGKGPLQESEANALDGDEQWMLSTCHWFAGSHVKSSQEALSLIKVPLCLGRLNKCQTPMSTP